MKTKQILKEAQDEDFQRAQENIKMALMKGTEIVFQFLREYVRVHNQDVVSVSLGLLQRSLFDLLLKQMFHITGHVTNAIK